ncbi:MAG: diaminopimelate epimerase [Rhabdaerophilum sp.]
MPTTFLHAEDGIFFRKMHGLGNDFVVIDARETSLTLNQPQLERIADRRFGIGCDQLIILETSTQANARMRIFNPDGGEVQACGNATRCIGHLLAAEAGRDEASIETVAGILVARREGNEIAVDMGLPVLDWEKIPLSGAGGDTTRVPLDLSALSPHLPGWFSAVNMGNPHGVFFVNDAQAIDLARVGPVIENHPIFPEKANISFAEIRSNGVVRLRVWERAAGATLACGTAACATAVAAQRLGLVGDVVRVYLPGGALTIRRSPEGRVIMIGPIAQSFTGFIPPALLAELA